VGVVNHDLWALDSQVGLANPTVRWLDSTRLGAQRALCSRRVVIKAAGRRLALVITADKHRSDLIEPAAGRMAPSLA
jgi:hypothetical protein